MAALLAAAVGQFPPQCRTFRIGEATPDCGRSIARLNGRMAIRHMTKTTQIAIVTFAVIAVAAVVFWQQLLFAVAVLIADKRPSLLADAEWQRPATARMFKARFTSGTSEADLFKWLHANRFNVNLVDKRAVRHVASLPCNEDVWVTWTLAVPGTLKGADAVITEAGCL